MERKYFFPFTNCYCICFSIFRSFSQYIGRIYFFPGVCFVFVETSDREKPIVVCCFVSYFNFWNISHWYCFYSRYLLCPVRVEESCFLDSFSGCNIPLSPAF